MSVKLKELKKPNLRRVKMSCDRIIDKRLTEFPMVRDCFSMNHFTMIVGGQGQGKTSLTVSLIRDIWAKCYEWIYVVMPEGSRRSIENDIFGKYLEDDQIYDDLTESTLESIYAKLEENSFYDENSLVIIDDFQSVFKNHGVAELLERMITKFRHLRTTVVLLQQSHNKLSKHLRCLVKNLIVFDVGKEQLLDIFDEAIKTKKHTFDDITDLAFQNEHDWLCINFKNRKIYKGFDEIIYK